MPCAKKPVARRDARTHQSKRVPACERVPYKHWIPPCLEMTTTNFQLEWTIALWIKSKGYKEEITREMQWANETTSLHLHTKAFFQKKEIIRKLNFHFEAKMNVVKNTKDVGAKLRMSKWIKTYNARTQQELVDSQPFHIFRCARLLRDWSCPRMTTKRIRVSLPEDVIFRIRRAVIKKRWRQLFII